MALVLLRGYLEHLLREHGKRSRRERTMIEDITNTELETFARFDAIIDVRSPAEFAEDHIPGAVSLPVLTNEERARIGSIYKQESLFRARRLGAACVARNVAGHLETALADKPKDFHPLLYCWRGGMRSNAMATILTRVGWRTGVLAGGYKTWRRSVVANLRDDGLPPDILLLDGQTGTAKSEILRRISSLGVQAVDLEALANHRGSVFGGVGEQPSQKFFESALWDALRRFDLSRPLLVEAESNRIGRCEVPKRLWNAMINAPRVILSSSVEARADYLLKTYTDITASEGAALDAVGKLARFHSKETIAEWGALAEARNFRMLAAALMRDHYDPLYDRSRARSGSATVLKRIEIADFDDATFDAVAEEIASALLRYETQGTP